MTMTNNFDVVRSTLIDSKHILKVLQNKYALLPVKLTVTALRSEARRIDHTLDAVDKMKAQHDALVAALEAAIPMLHPHTRTTGGRKRARLAAEAALKQVK